MSQGSVILCPACGVKLRIRPESQGKKRRCPRCEHLFSAQPAEVRQRTAAETPDQPERQPGSAEGQARVEKKRRRTKSKRVAKARAPGAWVWWWGSLALAVVLVGVGVVSIYQSGYPKLAVGIAARLIIQMPISAVIFAVSMFISNYLGAGVELADFSTLIPKALWIVLVANLAGIFGCFGWLMAFSVFFIGAVVVLKLEAWEARFLVLINWGLNWVAWFFLAATIASLAGKG